MDLVKAQEAEKQRQHKNSININNDNDNGNGTHNNLDQLYNLYGLYFKFVRTFGMNPLIFDQNTSHVQLTKGGGFYWFWKLNLIYIIAFVSKQTFLLAYTHLTNYKYDTMKGGFMFQGLWLSGYLLMASNFFNNVFKQEQVVRTMNLWLKLEHYIFVNFPPDQIKKHKRRINFIKLQFIICGFAIVGCFLTISALAFGIPHFPPFLNSYLLIPYLQVEKQAKANNNESLSIIESRPAEVHLRTYGLACVEAYTGFLAWTVVSSFDLLLSIMCCTVNHGFKKLTEVTNSQILITDQILDFYSSLRIIVTSLNLAFGQMLFLQEIFSMMATVLVLYGGLKYSTSSILLAAFFFVNTIALTFRIYLLYLPMSIVYMDSLKFKKLLSRKLLQHYKYHQHQSNNLESSYSSSIMNHENESNHQLNLKRIQQKVKSCRFMVFRPMGFHRVSPTSIADYMLAVLSYLVTAKNI